MSLVFISYFSTGIKISNGEEVIKKNSSVVRVYLETKPGMKLSRFKG